MSNDSDREYYQGPVECETIIAYATEGIEGEDAWLLGNIIKYVYRCGRKTDDPWHDVGKITDYSHKLITGKWAHDE